MTGSEHTKPLRAGDPQELGEYRIVGRIGRGGMGTVYLATDARGRNVAVKLIHPDLSDDANFRHRFAREVAAARSVARFSTAAVLDAQLEGEPLYIVSEYVAGPNLNDAIAAQGPMAEGTLESLAMGVAAALAAIHGAGVVHRDLKPANVLLSTVGPKVIDFGIARALDEGGGATRSSQLMGTPAYLAPELIEGGSVSPASDIFSWGCLVAFAGTGRAPFNAPTVPAVLHQITSKNPDLQGFDSRLTELVAQALSKDPENRPTAQQLLNYLVGHEEPSSAEVDRTVSTAWMSPAAMAPHPVPSAPPSGAPYAGPPPGGPPPGAYPPRPPQPQTGPGGGPLAGRRLHLLLGGGVLALVVLAVTIFAVTRPPGVPEGQLLYTEDFSNPEADAAWDRGSEFDLDETRGYDDGHFVLRAHEDAESSSESASYDAPLPNRHLVSTDTVVHSGPGHGQYGIRCFRQDDFVAHTYYEAVVDIDGSSAVLRRHVDEDDLMSGGDGDIDTESADLASTENVSGYQEPDTEAAGTDDETVNNLSLACEFDPENDTIQLGLWVNDRFVLDAEDSGEDLLPMEATEDDMMSDDPEAALSVWRTAGSGEDVVVYFDNFELQELAGS